MFGVSALRFCLAVLLTAPALVLGTTACAADCANRAVGTVASPDARLTAIIFERDCGATTGASTQISVLPSGQPAVGGGNVFIADTDHGAAPAGEGGGPAVRVRWVGRDTLEVRYHPRARRFAPQSRPEGITVRLVPDSSVGNAT